jgi:hypothetical protein
MGSSKCKGCNGTIISGQVCGTCPNKSPRKGLSLIQIIGAATAVLAIAATAGILAAANFQEKPEDARTVMLDNGVEAPVVPENAGHGWSTQENEVLRFETCEEWDNWWAFTGPAVSISKTEQYGLPGMSVSTENYIKNQHLDEDKDGILCFFENQQKPNFVAASREWLPAFDAVWDLVRNEIENDSAIDFASSPSTLPEHAETIRNGFQTAFKFWGPYIKPSEPLPVTVVHPNDKDWYLERIRETGGGGPDENWFDRSIETGGGAVASNSAGIPHTFFMASEDVSPPLGTYDFYFHEVTHIMENTGRAPLQDAVPCWVAEGPATFIGYSIMYPDAKQASLDSMMSIRVNRAVSLLRYFDAQGGLTEEGLNSMVLTLQNSDVTCQLEYPSFGYSLGMFVAERFILDFGMEGFVSLAASLNGGSISNDFEEVTGLVYEEWVGSILVPYMFEEIESLARG